MRQSSVHSFSLGVINHASYFQQALNPFLNALSRSLCLDTQHGRLEVLPRFASSHKAFDEVVDGGGVSRQRLNVDVAVDGRFGY